MSIRLYFSNRLDELAEKFASILDLENSSKQNIFNAPLVIAPNNNLIKWLQLVLARKQSVCMNMDFQFLENGLWGMLAELDAEKLNPKLLDNKCLQMLLVYALQNLDADKPEFKSINRYLFDSENIKRPDYTARLWQLSEKFARLFQEYEFHRSKMIKKWLENKVSDQGMELCQQKLYLLANELRDRLCDNSGLLYLSMMEYADRVFSEKSRKRKKENNFVHFFGLSQISSFHLNVIGRLSSYYEIFIYAFNPSREFWEDIKTPQERRWIKKRKNKLAITSAEIEQGELFAQEDNELLSLWGKPGRESIRLLCELTDHDFNACFIKDRSISTVLKKIQNNILTLSLEKSETQILEQDRSLQIFACPGIYREVETVYNNILYNLEQDKSLQLTDIAILVPDISKYKFVFDSVFNRFPKLLSYNLVDSQAEIESIFGRAVLSILDFATGRFSRKEVFDLILNPCFMKKWDISYDEIRIWAEWAKALNIFHGFDRSSKKEKGYLGSPYYTWKQGLQRLRLSRVMSAPAKSGNTALDSFNHFQGIVPYSDLNTGNADLIEKFGIVIERLRNISLNLNNASLSGKEWKDRFLKACDELLEIPPESTGEAAVKHALINSLDNLRIYDLLSEDNKSSKLDIETIKEFVRSSLSSISGGYGNYLTGGITISALQPMRPIPFKIVYVLGMEEGSFPGRAENSSLDLRLLKRQIGDISLPERNCYIFFEMLLSTRDKLYIGYISKDLQKDRILQPCSVVNQLRRHIEKEVLPQTHKFQFAEIPLKGSSSKYLDKSSVTDSSDVLVNYSMADRIAYYRENNLWDQVKEKALKDDFKNVAAFCPDFKQEPETVENDDMDAEKITLKKLQRYLQDPADQSIKQHLDIFDDKESIEEIVFTEDEPFYSEFPVDYNLKMESLNLWVDSAFSSEEIESQNPEDFFEKIYDNFQRQSKTPEGLFALTDKRELQEDVSLRCKTLLSVLEQMKSAEDIYRSVIIGDAANDYIPSAGRLCIKHFKAPALKIKYTNAKDKKICCTVELHGQIPWMWRDKDNKWHALVLTGSGQSPKKKPDKYILQPVLFYMCCLAGQESSDWIGNSGITFHVLYKENIKKWSYNISKESSINYLKQLLADYFDQKKLHWLPFKPATSTKVRPYEIADDEITENIRADFQIQFEEAISKYEDDLIKENKAALIKLAKPEIPLDAFDKARQRFKIFFENIRE